MEFKNKNVEAAAKGLAKTKSDFAGSKAIGAYQQGFITLAMQYPADAAAIYEVAGMSEQQQSKPVIRTPVKAVGRSQAALAKQSGKAKPDCPTCGKKKAQPQPITNPVKAVQKASRKPEEVPTEPEDMELKNRIDELVGDIDTQKTASEIALETYDNLENEYTKEDRESAEAAERQKAIDELTNLHKEDLSKPAPVEEKKKRKRKSPKRDK